MKSSSSFSKILGIDKNALVLVAYMTTTTTATTTTALHLGHNGRTKCKATAAAMTYNVT